jgi:hypothetical protein
MPQKFYAKITYTNHKGGLLRIPRTDSNTCREAFIGDASNYFTSEVLPLVLSSDLRRTVDRLFSHWMYTKYAYFWLTREHVCTEIRTNISDNIDSFEAISMVAQLRELFPSVEMCVEESEFKRTSIFDRGDEYRRYAVFKSSTHQLAFNPAWWWIYLNRKLSVLEYTSIDALRRTGVKFKDTQGNNAVNLQELVHFSTRDEDIYYSPTRDHPNTVEYWKVCEARRATRPIDWLYAGDGPMGVRSNPDLTDGRAMIRQTLIREFKENNMDLCARAGADILSYERPVYR